MTPATHPKMTDVSITVDLAEDYTDIREQVAKLCQDFTGEYWRDLEKQPPSGSYPTAFIEALTAAGYLAALIPEEYGGSGLPVRGGAVILETINATGAGRQGPHAHRMMGAAPRHIRPHNKTAGFFILEIIFVIQNAFVAMDLQLRLQRKLDHPFVLHP